MCFFLNFLNFSYLRLISGQTVGDTAKISNPQSGYRFRSPESNDQFLWRSDCKFSRSEGNIYTFFLDFFSFKAFLKKKLLKQCFRIV